jgi:RNA polymerase sigma-70 factor (ECF subfamily)
MAAETDRSLVRAARTGRASAYDELVRRHWRPAWRAAYALTRSHASAEDAVQDAFLRAFGRLDRFDADRPFAPWICRIAVNCAIDQLRRTRAHELPEPAPEAASDDPQLWSALAELRLERRAPIVLHYLLGYSFDEVAELLEIPRGTVASRVTRGLGELRQTMEVRRAG